MIILGDNVQSIKFWMDTLYPVTCVYADMVYENDDLEWVRECYKLLDPDIGVMYVQTDYHTIAQVKLFMDDLFGEKQFLNHLIYKQEWGGISKRFFPRKHDDILLYAKGNHHKFYYDRIMIPKVTAGTSLDKRGDGLKIPCDVFDDLGNFHTMDSERIKGSDGKNIKWQKPLKLMDRLLLPVTDEDDMVVDPFLGSGTTGVWCELNNRRFFGVENDPEIFNIASKRIEEAENEL